MKNYKLIKTYPGSPDLGYVTKKGVNDGIVNPNKFPEFWKLVEPKYVKCISRWPDFTIGKIYNWPEPIDDHGLKQTTIFNFSSWDKVFEESTKEEYNAQFVDYQILAIKDSINNDVFTLRENGEYVVTSIKQWNNRKDILYDASFFFKDSRYVIYSVKRLSDNKVFTIGDRIIVGTKNYDVKYACYSKMGASFIIQSFILDKDTHGLDAPIGIYVQDTKDGFYITINYLNEVKTPIFTTEDNVPICEGDSYWFVWTTKNCARGQEPMVAYYVKQFIPVTGATLCDDAKYFSTQKAAENYIDKHKVLIVTDDNVNLYRGDKCHHLYRHSPLSEWCSNIIITGQFGKWDDGNHMYFSTKQALDDYLVKIEVLFVTEDGVDLRLGDSFYGVNVVDPPHKIYKHVLDKFSNQKQAKEYNCLWFSTEQKAEEYIELNKPKYSINQIKEAFRELNLDLTVAIRICVHIANTNSK